jgi:hypothetical protein
MLKRLLILVLFVVSQLSAEVSITPKEHVKDSFSYKQKVVICSAMIVGSAGVAIIFAKTIMDCLLSKGLDKGAKALRFTAALGAFIALSIAEDTFFEKNPNFFETGTTDLIKQENVPC